MHGVRKCFLAIPCSIYIPPIVLHWYLTKRDHSAVSLLQAKTGVLIRVATDVHKIESRAFHGADVLTPGQSKLKTVWLFSSEAQLLRCLIKQKGRLGVGHRHPVIMCKASITNKSMK